MSNWQRIHTYIHSKHYREKARRDGFTTVTISKERLTKQQPRVPSTPRRRPSEEVHPSVRAVALARTLVPPPPLASRAHGIHMRPATVAPWTVTARVVADPE